MVNHNGVMSLWTRSAPTVTRAMLVTDAQLDSYDQNKETIIEHHEVPGGLAIQVVASFGAGVFASVASNSIDVLKTRVMNVLKTRMMNTKVANGERFKHRLLSCHHNTLSSILL
jgi:hypothetical protein